MFVKDKIKILLVDDHVLLRECMRDTLNQQDNILVTAESDNGRDALRHACENNPDVVIMDISMPDLNGIDATKQIVRMAPQTKIIALSMHAEKHYVISMLKAGATGYLLKTGPVDELLTSIKTVIKGKVYLSPDIAHLVVDSAVNPMEQELQSGLHTLTDREREILQLLTEGRSLDYIVDNLNISKKTIQTHRHHLMKKLNVNSVAELTKFAIKEGIISLDT